MKARPGKPPALQLVDPTDTERQAAWLARGEGAAGRARAVLRHPDLARQLARALRLADPQQWSGYVPPRTWHGGYNNSPQRRAVVEICAEAHRRENTRQTRQETR